MQHSRDKCDTIVKMKLTKNRQLSNRVAQITLNKVLEA